MRILDGIDGVNSDNIVVNENPGVSINIYTNNINLENAINKNYNLTFIELGQCANRLREYYKLSSEQKFCIISVDMLTKNSKKPTNDFVYEIYLDNGTQLEDLSPCEDIPISISAPIINFDLINYGEAKIFEEQGYDIYDSSSEFYRDKCTAAYINGNDIIIEDRIKDIYPHNVSICPNGCGFNNADLNNKRFNCSCNISFINNDLESENDEKEQLNVQTDESFLAYLLDMINYKIFRCPKIIKNSNIKDYFTNVGFYLGVIVIIFNIISLSIFFCYFLFQIRLEIFKLIPNQMKLFEKEKEFQKQFKNSNLSADNIEEIVSNPLSKKSNNGKTESFSDGRLKKRNKKKKLKCF